MDTILAAVAQRSRRGGSLLAFAILAITFAGCGPPRTVTGRVSFEGKPVEYGTINFEPAGGKGPTSGAEIKDGAFQLTGTTAPPPGEYLVRIRAFGKSGKKVSGLPATNEMVDEVIQLIPPEFNDRSTLNAFLGEGRVVEHNFDLFKAR